MNATKNCTCGLSAGNQAPVVALTTGITNISRNCNCVISKQFTQCLDQNRVVAQRARQQPGSRTAPVWRQSTPLLQAQKSPTHFTKLLLLRGRTSVKFKSFLFDHLLRQLLFQLRDVEEVVIMMQNWDIENLLDVHGLKTTHQRKGARNFWNFLNERRLLKDQERCSVNLVNPVQHGAHEDSDTTPRMTHGAAKPAETPAARQTMWPRPSILHVGVLGHGVELRHRDGLHADCRLDLRAVMLQGSSHHLQ